MTGDIENLVLEQLRKIRGVLDDHTARFGEVQTRLTGIERQLARISRDGGETYAELIGDRHRLDKVVQRIERIERRLELED